MNAPAGLAVFLLLRGRPCLVVGGGQIATRKVERLLAAEAEVQVVAPQLCPELARLATGHRIRHLETVFQLRHLDGVRLVVAATSDADVNRAVSTAAQDRGVLVNVVDCPELCTFTMPAVVERPPVQVAIGTGGAAPLLARVLRARIETWLPSNYGKLADLLARNRQQVAKRFADTDSRRRFWEEVLEGPIAELVVSGQEQEAEQRLAKLFEQEPNSRQNQGEVYLVGAGPGDPDLLNFRALRLMQRAEVVIYDRLVAPELLQLVRRDAKRIYVGKQRDSHTIPQADINQLMIDLASAGRRVLRMKGGDPFIFGRGGEEIAELATHRVPFQVVPGITAASGCACYAGIPLTHRDYAQSCTFVTGHLQDGQLKLNWQALAQPRQTLAVYMGVGAAAALAEGLIKHGMEPDTPAAVIEHGTTPRQRIVTGTLLELPALVAMQKIAPPSLFIIGQVVRLREQLTWRG